MERKTAKIAKEKLQLETQLNAAITSFEATKKELQQADGAAATHSTKTNQTILKDCRRP